VKSILRSKNKDSNGSNPSISGIEANERVCTERKEISPPKIRERNIVSA
jgi:hypothetical protein